MASFLTGPSFALPTALDRAIFLGAGRPRSSPGRSLWGWPHAAQAGAWHRKPDVTVTHRLALACWGWLSLVTLTFLPALA